MMNILGTTLHQSSDPYYGQAFARSGETVMLAVEVLNLEASGSATLDIEVQHKNFGDTGWTVAGSLAQFTTKGTKEFSGSGLKEQLRLKFTVGATGGDFVRVFIYEPTWKG